MFRLLPSLLVAATILAACSSPARRTPVPLSPAQQARADSGRPPYTAADVRFMQGMIAHHAQAVYMSSLASSHRARPDVRTLAGRIDVAQRDEIAFMQHWLAERHEPVPAATVSHDMSAMSSALMPGMLTHEQLMQLDEAAGADFDRLFLTFMIQHHRGALTMVDQLFASPGAAQDGQVFRFASDVTADQSTEIERMRGMLSTVPSPRQ